MTSQNENIPLSNYSFMGIKKKSRLHLFCWIFFKSNNSIYFLGKMKNILIYPIIWICTYFFLLQRLQVHNHKIIFILVFRDCNSAIWQSCSFIHVFSYLSSNRVFSTSDNVYQVSTCLLMSKHTSAPSPHRSPYAWPTLAFEFSSKTTHWSLHQRYCISTLSY